MKKISSILAGTLITLSTASPAFAHEHPGYSHNENIGYENKNWMNTINDSTRLSRLSIPGTHDSMSTGNGGDIAQTQSMSLETQLNSGIRYLDIRCALIGGAFHMYHGIMDLGTKMEDVLNITTKFLKEHPSETILMRVKQENSSASDAEFNQKMQDYINGYKDFIWDSKNRTVTNPTLGEMRGKIVLLPNVSGSSVGIDYGGGQFNIQDNYNLNTNWDLYSKWESVKGQLQKASDLVGDPETKYINYLSGSGGAFPYFVASGHVSHETDAGRLWTGALDITDPSKYKDFPRINGGIYYEGTNVLTTDYLNTFDSDNHAAIPGEIRTEAVFPKRTGIIVADFPGKGLIDAVIKHNVSRVLPNGWVKEKGTWHYYNADGILVKNDWIQDKGKYYYLTQDGSIIAGRDSVMETGERIEGRNTKEKYALHFNGSGELESIYRTDDGRPMSIETYMGKYKGTKLY
ncbi:phosphatidylinositol-specific phospholipase C [Bacillus cereus]